MKKSLVIKIIAFGSLFSCQAIMAEEVEKRVPEKMGYQSYLFKKIDKNIDGKLSKEETLALVNEEFNKRDLNKDGFITKDEIHSLKKEDKL